MKKFIKSITIFEWIIWCVSVASIIICFILFKNSRKLYLIGSLVGATALLFVSKGNPIGQFLTIIFGVIYGIVSYSYKYYGEMITYLGISTPVALWALIVWLKNPYKGNKCEIRINSLSYIELIIFLISAVALTLAFYFILKALNTNHLVISTFSVFTSVTAAYFTARRSRFYAVGYALNDIILIILWSIASYDDITYLPMVICFITFLLLDIYGFVNWSIIYKHQKNDKDDKL